ncbi:MAG: hypothetical protein ACD_73C00271G0001 [uncultured bacterium]|nr:MAG: hypothetical protein ACD_73C00271G0001 [uncultured bacterium]
MNTQNLKYELSQFTGTEQYYRFHELLLTDGTYYLAEAAKCFWFIDVIWSYVGRWLDKEDFITCKLTVNDSIGKVVFDDGNKNVLASQTIPYTDFPLDKIQLYIVRQDNQFVVMLPSEY